MTRECLHALGATTISLWNMYIQRSHSKMAHCIYSHYLKYICGKHLAFLDSCHDGLIWQVRNNDKHLTFVNNSSRHPRITQLLQSSAAEYLFEPGNSAPTAMSRLIKPTPSVIQSSINQHSNLGVNEKLMAAWHRQPHHTDRIAAHACSSAAPAAGANQDSG